MRRSRARANGSSSKYGTKPIRQGFIFARNVLFVTEVGTDNNSNTIFLTLVAALRARNLDGFFSDHRRMDSSRQDRALGARNNLLFSQRATPERDRPASAIVSARRVEDIGYRLVPLAWAFFAIFFPAGDGCFGPRLSTLQSSPVYQEQQQRDFSWLFERLYAPCCWKYAP
jgi:hypothetical protein